MRRLFLIISLLALLTPVRSMAQDDSVVDGYRHFIMPTGKPIEGGYFGFWELAFLTGGYGFGDVLCQMQLDATCRMRWQPGCSLSEARSLRRPGGMCWS